MRLVTFELGGRIAAGALLDETALVDLADAGDVLRILSDPAARARAQTHLEAQTRTFSLSEVRLLPPLQPRALIGIGLNYRDHVRETGAVLPSAPIIFAKFPNAVAGPGETIVWHAEVARQVDYEAELGVIIGKPCRNVRSEHALDYVGGYTCVNDLSARDLQFADSGKQWTLGKTLDGFCPIGPAVVTADEIPDPNTLEIRCLLNGEVVQHSNTREMIFDVPTLIAHLSCYMTLMPGDLIATGTPAGVGMGRTPPRWLRDGDVCTVEIERIGALTNTMRCL